MSVHQRSVGNTGQYAHNNIPDDCDSVSGWRAAVSGWLEELCVYELVQICVAFLCEQRRKTNTIPGNSVSSIVSVRRKLSWRKVLIVQTECAFLKAVFLCRRLLRICEC